MLHPDLLLPFLRFYPTFSEIQRALGQLFFVQRCVWTEVSARPLWITINWENGWTRWIWKQGERHLVLICINRVNTKLVFYMRTKKHRNFQRLNYWTSCFLIALLFTSLTWNFPEQVCILNINYNQQTIKIVTLQLISQISKEGKKWSKIPTAFNRLAGLFLPLK